MKALSASIVPGWLRLLAAHVLILPALATPSRLQPQVSPQLVYMNPPITGWAKWSRWVAWSIWRPVDWFLYEDYYAHLTRRMTHPPRVTPSAHGYPPPTYRKMCEMLAWLETAPVLPDGELF